MPQLSSLRWRNAETVIRIFGLAGVLIIIIAVSGANSKQTLKEKMTPPADSVSRENLRIWVPIERTSSCRLSVDILDSAGLVLRHFIDYVAQPGYYNLYWDKRDDSDKFVEPGIYKVVIDDCGNKSERKVKAEFVKWEKESLVDIDKDTSGFRLSLLLDSANVRVDWYTFNKRLVVTLFIEDGMAKGEYHFNWTGVIDGKNINLIPDLKPGLYVQKVKVGDFIHADTIRFFK